MTRHKQDCAALTEARLARIEDALDELGKTVYSGNVYHHWEPMSSREISPCPYLVTDEEGTSHCALAQQEIEETQAELEPDYSYITEACQKAQQLLDTPEEEK